MELILTFNAPDPEEGRNVISLVRVCLETGKRTRGQYTWKVLPEGTDPMLGPLGHFQNERKDSAYWLSNGPITWVANGHIMRYDPNGKTQIENFNALTKALDYSKWETVLEEKQFGLAYVCQKPVLAFEGDTVPVPMEYKDYGMYSLLKQWYEGSANAAETFVAAIEYYGGPKLSADLFGPDCWLELMKK